MIVKNLFAHIGCIFILAVTSDHIFEKVFDLGIRDDTDLILQILNSSYVNKQIYNNHVINNIIGKMENE